MPEPGIVKKVKENSAYYSVTWSKLKKADKYDISTTVPSVAGLYELFYLDECRKLKCFYMSLVWYGGLREEIRRYSDPELEKDLNRHRVLNTYPIYYRYTIGTSYGDLCDLLYFFSACLRPGNRTIVHSGRYEMIYVNEISQDDLLTVKPEPEELPNG